MDDHWREFVRESEEGITALNAALLELEESPGDGAAMDDVFRIAHTLKGNCAAVGLTPASDLAHAVEDLLDAVRRGELSVDPELMDAIFDSVDVLESMIEDVERHGEVRTDPAATIDALRELLEGAAVEAPTDAEIDALAARSAAPADAAHEVYVVRLAIDAGDGDVDGGHLVVEALEDAFDLLGTDPSRESIEAGEYDGTVDAVFATPVDERAISAALEPVDPIAAFEIATATGRIEGASGGADPVEGFGDDVSTDRAREMSVDELLGEFDELDDLDSLVDEVDDVGEFDDLGSAGSFDDVLEDDGDDGVADGADAAAGEPEEATDDASAVFDELKAEVETVEFEELQEELEELEFDEFDEEEVSIDELLDDVDGTDEPASTASAARPDPADPGEDGSDLEDSSDEDGSDREESFDEDGSDREDDPVEGLGDEPVEGESGAAAFDDDPDALGFDEDDPLAVEEPDLEFDPDAGETLDGAESFEDATDLEVGSTEFDDEPADAFETTFEDDSFEAERWDDSEAWNRADDAADDVDDGSLDGIDDAPQTGSAGSIAPATAGDGADGTDVGATASATGEARTAPRSGESDSERAQSVRVDVERVDSLLTLVQGLVTSRIRLRHAIEEGEGAETIETELDDLEDVTEELREAVMDVRLVPLSTATNRLPRIVRDVAREEGKDASLETSGEDVELDRTVLDRIGDPLTHLIRNAVDHGIEPPDEREEAGKPSEGTVELRASRSRGRVTITVEDDGRGLDADDLREAAVDAGVRSGAEAADLSDEGAYELIFEPGLSTVEEVTDVSGRGVGMDVVERTIDDLGGSVSVRSEPGEGTAVTMELPVTVAVAEVVFLERGGETFGVPVDDVETVEGGSRVETVDGRTVVPDGDEGVPTVDLADALDVPEAGRLDDGEGTVVRIRDDVRRIALRCDEVSEQRDVVVKPFDGFVRGVPGLDGATIRGRGEVVTILDVSTL